MPTSPSVENYTLGRGKVFFNKFDPLTQTYDGERDMGNAPTFSPSVALEKLPHFSSRSGLKTKDKEVVLSVTPACAFTLDEINVENVALQFMADVQSVSQPANPDGVAMLLSGVKPSRYYPLNYRNVAGGVSYLPYNTGTAIFNVGETVTGGTSGATAIVAGVFGTAVNGVLVLDTSSITGTFQDAETLTGDGGVPGAAAVNSATGVVVTGAAEVLVTTEDGTVIFTQGEDYTIDARTGRIGITSADISAIVAGVNINVAFTVQALNYTRIAGFKKNTIEGTLRFVPENPAGNNMELQIWRVSLSPSGEMGMISDEWQAMEFQGEILADEANHPDTPYMDIITEDVV